MALHGLLGISELTPCAQKRREAGRPVGADMAPDDPVLLRQLTQMICLSDLTQQTACRCVSYIQRTHAPRRAYVACSTRLRARVAAMHTESEHGGEQPDHERAQSQARLR